MSQCWTTTNLLREEKEGRDTHVGQTLFTGVRWVSGPSLIEDLLTLLRQHCPEKGI